MTSTVLLAILTLVAATVLALTGTIDGASWLALVAGSGIGGGAVANLNAARRTDQR